MHRSGTTVIARVLKEFNKVNLVHELFNPSVGASRVVNWYTDNDIVPLFTKLAKRRYMNFLSLSKPRFGVSRTFLDYLKHCVLFRRSLLLKDPFVIFGLSDILKKDDSVRVIVVVRNPLSVIDSINKMSWIAERDKIRVFDDKFRLSEDDFNLTLWLKIYDETYKVRSEFPDRLLIIKQEDLIRNSEMVWDRLFRFFDHSEIPDFSAITKFLSKHPRSKDGRQFNFNRSKDDFQIKGRVDVSEDLLNLVRSTAVYREFYV